MRGRRIIPVSAQLITELLLPHRADAEVVDAPLDCEIETAYSRPEKPGVLYFVVSSSEWHQPELAMALEWSPTIIRHLTETPTQIVDARAKSTRTHDL